MTTEEHKQEIAPPEKVRPARAGKLAAATVMAAPAAIAQTAPAAIAQVATTVETSKDQVKKMTETQFKAADEMAAFGKANIEAFLHAGSVFFHGVEQLTRSMVGISQAHMESGLSTAKALISAKTLTEFTELQNAYAKSSFDSALSEATQLSEIAIRMTNEALEPLSARISATIEHVSKPTFAI
jgi:phasin family protein